jgi:hypothetical protein
MAARTQRYNVVEGSRRFSGATAASFKTREEAERAASSRDSHHHVRRGGGRR